MHLKFLAYKGSYTTILTVLHLRGQDVDYNSRNIESKINKNLSI